MDKIKAARMIDISTVRSHHTLEDIKRVVDVAKRYSFINVHSLPCWTRTVREMLNDTPDIYTGAPVGFPSGAHVTDVKLMEAERLIEDGVQEMDIVMNIGRFKNREYYYVLGELKKVIDISPDNVLTKVIIEINTLTDEEIDVACNLVMQSGADFIKTGTGWIPGNIDLSRIARIKDLTRGAIKLKVAGGVRTLHEFEKMCGLGVERFGINTESAIQIVKSYESQPEPVKRG